MRSRVLVSSAAAIAAIALIAGFGLAGGTLNHLRGGWMSLPQLASDNYFSHDLTLRLTFAIPTGVVLWLAFSMSSPSACISGAVVAASLCLWGLMSLYTDWSSYFSLGNEGVGSQARAGVFDWLVGPPLIATDENQRQRLLRDAAGMALRGLQQTAVPGFLIAMYSASLRGSAVTSSSSSGSAWVKTAAAAYALSGAAMALMYELGQLPTADPDGSTAWLGPFQPGIPLCELLWGAWTWMTLAAVFSTFAVAATFAQDHKAKAGAARTCCSALPFGGLLKGLAGCCFCYGRAEAAPAVREAVLCPCLPLAADHDDAEQQEEDHLLEAPKARTGSRASLLPYSGDILAAATGEERGSKFKFSIGGSSSRACNRLGCAAQVLFHGFLFAYACVLLASGIWYNASVTQDDARSKFQSTLGVFAVAAPLLAFQLAACIGCLCIARQTRRAGVSRRQARDQLVVSCCPPCLLCSCAVGVDDLLDETSGCCISIPCCSAGRARCLCGRTAARVAGDVGGYVLEAGTGSMSGSSSVGAGLLGGGLARSFAVAGAGDHHARQGGSAASVSVLYAGGAGGTSGSAAAAGREAAFLDAVDAAIGASAVGGGASGGHGRYTSGSALSGVDARARGRSRGRSSMAIAAVTAKYAAVGAVNADRAAEYSSAAAAGGVGGAAAISPPGSPSLYMPLAAAAGGLLTGGGAVDWGAESDSQKDSRIRCGWCCSGGKSDTYPMLPSVTVAGADAAEAKESCADACGTGVLCAMRSFLALATVTGALCCVGCVAVIIWARVEGSSSS